MPLLSVVVLAWDQLHLTRRCAASIRVNTDVPYELIVVDNGSAPEAAEWARRAADRAVLLPTNQGFAKGMNAGLKVARGRYVAFLNNDTAVPPSWAGVLCADLEQDSVGLVTPAVTAAGNRVGVRSAVGSNVVRLPRYQATPSGVAFVLRRDHALRLGGWGEEFEVASGEDADLCFKVWANDLDIVLDERVLVDHVSKGTAAVKLPDYAARWRANRQLLLAKWTTPHPAVPRLPSCPQGVFEANLGRARATARNMQLYFAVVDVVGAGALPSGMVRSGRVVSAAVTSSVYRCRRRGALALLVRGVRRSRRLERLLQRHLRRSPR